MSSSTIASIGAAATVDHKVEEYDIVVFSSDDPEDPRRWSSQKKAFVVALSCIYAFCGVFGSSIYAPGEGQIRAKFGVNEDVSSTGLTVYVLGLGLGPLIWGPLSEHAGRRLPYHFAWVILVASAACSAFIENIVAIMIFRLIMGCAAACPLTVGVAINADLYAHDLKGMGRATMVLSFCALNGPCIATLIGFFIAAHTSGGLWVLRVQFFFTVAVWPLVFLLPETYPLTILANRAKKLRKAGNAMARAAHEIQQKTAGQLIKGHVIRPFTMIIYEPIVQGAAIWVTISYGILYFFFEEYPVVFITQHGISFQLCGLMFLFVSLGMALSVLTFDPLVKLAEHTRLPLIEKKGVRLSKEEAHLKVVLPACILLPASLFWFAWTSGPNVSWIAPAFAGIPFGYANTVIFFAFISYTSRVYSLYASSATAANTFFRSVVASIFPVVAHTITQNMGTEWGITVFAFISLGLIPIPFIFVRYGPALRRRSRHAREAQELIARMHGWSPRDMEEDEEAPQVDEESTTQIPIKKIKN